MVWTWNSSNIGMVRPFQDNGELGRWDAQPKVAVQLGTSVLESRSIVLLSLDDNSFNQSWSVFRDRYQDLPLSFIDCTSYVLLQLHNITNTFSFNKDFDALGLNRIPK